MKDKCRGCGADIIWLRNNITGKRAPIDAKSVPDGNIAITNHTYAIVPNPTTPSLAAKLHKSHFATCSKAQDFR